MTNETKEIYLAGQARVLATILLTRRGDLNIVETKKNSGLDLHVYIERDDKPMRLVFGVLLRGMVPPGQRGARQPDPRADDGPVPGDAEVHLPRLPVLFHHAGGAGVLFLAGGAGRERRRAKLVHHEQPNCVPLNYELVDQIVERVVAWFDAVEPVLIG